MNKEVTISTLNDLIEINNDRIVGYETANKETKDADLHIIFSKFLETSKKNVDELKGRVLEVGGDTEKGTNVTGKLHRLWMDFKATFSENNRASILSSCEFGDDVAVKTYKENLDGNLENLDAALQSLIMKQQAAIEKEYNEIVLLQKVAE